MDTRSYLIGFAIGVFICLIGIVGAKYGSSKKKK